MHKSAALLTFCHWGLQVYANTRAAILDAASNQLYFKSEALLCSVGEHLFDPDADALGQAALPVQWWCTVRADRNANWPPGDKLEGLGSTHTPSGHVWPLAMMVEGLTSASAADRVALLRRLLQLQVSIRLHRHPQPSLLLLCLEEDLHRCR